MGHCEEIAPQRQPTGAMSPPTYGGSQ